MKLDDCVSPTESLQLWMVTVTNVWTPSSG
jgi:hypothetical protein